MKRNDLVGDRVFCGSGGKKGEQKKGREAPDRNTEAESYGEGFASAGESFKVSSGCR